MQTITSRQNPLVTRFRAVARAGRATRAALLLDGTTLVDEARRTGVPLEIVVVSKPALIAGTRAVGALVDRLHDAGVEVVAASQPVIARISPSRSPAAAVAIARHRPTSLARALNRRGLVLAPVGVQDPGNVGAIIRVADAASARGVVVTGSSADPFGWKAIRGAMGSSFRVPVADVEDPAVVIATARDRGLRPLAAVASGGPSLYTIDLTTPLMVLLGGEGSGLDAAIVSAVDGCLTVPMRRPVESLNTSVAAAVIAYEALRQREGVSGR